MMPCLTFLSFGVAMHPEADVLNEGRYNAGGMTRMRAPGKVTT